MAHKIILDNNEVLFFQLLQVALGNRSILSEIPSRETWTDIFNIAQKQALLGITFHGIERMPKEYRPEKSLLLKWYTIANSIKQKNLNLNNQSIIVANRLLNDGFKSVILKGQGIAKYHDVSEYRTPGDIDIWTEGSREDILKLTLRYSSLERFVYHNVPLPPIQGTAIELHFTPSWMNCYFTNRKLQKFFKLSANFIFADNNNIETNNGILSYTKLPTPSLEFNRVFILVHIYRHLFGEGIGLRQLMDYYFVLKQGFTEQERLETLNTLASLKMTRFAGAVMYIMQTVFSMSDDYLLLPPKENEGKFLLEEIMLSGNFGHYDVRNNHNKKETSLQTFTRRVTRNFRFIKSYPTEVIWTPIFKIWHYIWRHILLHSIKNNRT